MSQKIDGVQVGKTKANFSILPNAVLRGGHGLHLAVLGAIVSHGDCWASVPTLAKEAGCGTNFVNKSLKYWQRIGPAFGIFLRVTSGQEKGKTNTIVVDIDHTLQAGGSIPGVGGSIPGVDKEEPYKKITIRRDTNNNAPDGAEASGVNQVFKVFYENGSPGIKYGNKTLRKDAQWLIDQFGLEETTRLAEVACKIQGEQYAPTITNPSQLRDKLASIKKFIDRSNAGGMQITFIPDATL